MILQNVLVPAQSEEAVFAPKNNLSPEKIIAHLTDLSQEVATTSLRDKSHPLRQDVNSQFFTAKIQLENGSGKQNSGQQLLQNNDETSSQNSQASPPKLSNSSAETQFSQSLTTFAGDKTNHQLPVEQIRPAVPFLNSPVSENEILQQVIQKFRISQHLQDSRVVMKLHPAELGELKVDIHLKDGTINASIQVQSRQVLEILEKNMPRLREIMEQQGLRIDEMVLNIDKDMPADHNLFEEQLAQNDNPFFNRKRSATQLPFELINEDSISISADNTALSQTAVNVTI
jgi:flagellar hook-length control protein FliK